MPWATSLFRSSVSLDAARCALNKTVSSLSGDTVTPISVALSNASLALCFHALMLLTLFLFPLLSFCTLWLHTDGLRTIRWALANAASYLTFASLNTPEGLGAIATNRYDKLSDTWSETTCVTDLNHSNYSGHINTTQHQQGSVSCGSHHISVRHVPDMPGQIASC